jgi:hypothetical protein
MSSVLDQDVAGPVDAFQEREGDAVDLGHRLQLGRLGMPDISFGRGETDAARPRRRQTLERVSDPL